MGPTIESLTSLAERLAVDRRRAVDELLASAGAGSLPQDLLARLGHLQAALLAVLAEIDSRTPSLGHGAEA
jgi:hypothetical protein